MLRKSSELSIKDFYCVFVCTEMNLIAFSGPRNCVNMQYAALSGAMSDELYCVTKEQPHIAYLSLYLFIFLSLQWKFLSEISQLLLEPVFSNFVYIFRMAKCTV